MSTRKKLKRVSQKFQKKCFFHVSCFLLFLGPFWPPLNSTEIYRFEAFFSALKLLSFCLVFLCFSDEKIKTWNFHFFEKENAKYRLVLGTFWADFLAQKPCSNVVRVVKFNVFNTFAFCWLPGSFFWLIFVPKQTETRFAEISKKCFFMFPVFC